MMESLLDRIEQVISAGRDLLYPYNEEFPTREIPLVNPLETKRPCDGCGRECRFYFMLYIYKDNREEVAQAYLALDRGLAEELIHKDYPGDGWYCSQECYDRKIEKLDGG